MQTSSAPPATIGKYQIRGRLRQGAGAGDGALIGVEITGSYLHDASTARLGLSRPLGPYCTFGQRNSCRTPIANGLRIDPARISNPAS